MKRFAFALLALLALALVTGVSATTFFVCPGGCNATTAQGGINLASPGDTVSLSFGTLYIENISVNVSITLEGNGATVFAPGGTGVSVLAPNTIVQNIVINNAPRGMYVNASNVTLRNVTLDHIHNGLEWNNTANATLISSLANDSRVTFEGVNRGTVRDTVFVDGFSGLSLGGVTNFTVTNDTFIGSTIAIGLDGSNSSTFTNISTLSADGLTLVDSFNNTVNNMTVYAGSSGLSISGASAGNVITNSVFSDNGFADVYLYPNTPADCNNTFTNVSTTGMLPLLYYSRSVDLENTTASELFLCNAGNSTITNVTVNGSSDLLGTGITLFFTDNVTLNHVNVSFAEGGITSSYSNNVFVRNSFFMMDNGQGISATSGEGFLVDNVTILNASISGMRFDTVNQSTILHSTIVGGFAGIALQNGELFVLQNNTITGANEGIYANTATLSFLGNNTITGGDTGIYLDSDATENLVVNNFLNNTYDVVTDGIVANVFNEGKTTHTNIIGGPKHAGNFYAAPDGTGFSQTCADADLDELCDTNYTIDDNNVDMFPLARIHSDVDGDGIIDEADPLTGNVSNITVDGGGAVNLTIGNGTLGNNLTGVQPIVVAVNNSPVLNFTFNFSANSIDFSKVIIAITGNGIAINLSGQLQPGQTKTVFLDDNGYGALCIKDADVSSITDLSADCTGVNETDFSACIGNAGGTTIGSVSCYDEGSRFRITGLTHSAVRGGPAPVVVPSGGGGGGGGHRGGGGGGGSYTAPVTCGDGTCASSETCTTCPADCGACPAPVEEKPAVPVEQPPAAPVVVNPDPTPSAPKNTVQQHSTPVVPSILFWVASLALLVVFVVFTVKYVRSE